MLLWTMLQEQDDEDFALFEQALAGFPLNHGAAVQNAAQDAPEAAQEETQNEEQNLEVPEAEGEESHLEGR